MHGAAGSLARGTAGRPSSGAVAAAFTVGGLATVLGDGDDAPEPVAVSPSLPQSDAQYMDPRIPRHLLEPDRAIPQSDAQYMDPRIPAER